LSPSMRLGFFTLRISRSAAGQSCAWPPVNRIAIRRPLASASAWIFVLRPPRERPTACFFSPLFLRQPNEAIVVENQQAFEQPPTAVNVTVRSSAPREYLTEREVERLIKGPVVSLAIAVTCSSSSRGGSAAGVRLQRCKSAR
jgi:hypothetical protein